MRKRSHHFLAALTVALLTNNLSSQTYEEWRVLNFTTTQLQNSSVSSASADPDTDGIPNLMEYVFNLSPWANNPPRTSSGISNNHLTLTYPERNNLAPTQVWLQGTDDLQKWTTYNTKIEISRIAASGFNAVTLQDPVALGTNLNRRFIRLKIYGSTPILEAPTQLEVGFNSPTNVIVKWTDTNTIETGYTVTHFDYNFYENIEVATTGPDTISASGIAVSLESGFNFLVTANGPNGTTAESNWIQAPDADGDGLPDYFERQGQSSISGTFNSNPNSYDTDNDGLSDGEEVLYYHTDPSSADSDRDGIPDGWEVNNSTDPLINDATADNDSDGLTNIQEYTAGTYPYYADSDGDGLTDGAEVNTYHTDPLLVDTDGDGMPDGWEITYSFNPNVASDAQLDADSDGVSNIWEFKLGLNPRSTDTDGNGTTDGDEDLDSDGLKNSIEINTYGTDPTQPDSDNDGLNDGWELKYGFPPLVNNLSDNDPSNDPSADPDNDGLKNAEEEQIDSNPLNSDTDGDGFSDFAENAAGSNAGNATNTPNSNGTSAATRPPIVTLNVNFGDHSGSHSEKYKVSLEPLSGDANTAKRYRTNANYGQTQNSTFNVPAGAKYKITLTHIGTDPQYTSTPKPDYDYTLAFSTSNTSSNIAIINEDPQGILGVHDESTTFYASGKSATLNVAWLNSLADANTPADKKRTKLGVGETVFLLLKPSSLPSPIWTLEGTPGTTILTTNGSTANLDASTRASTPKVKVTTSSKALTIDYNIIEPTGETATKSSETPYPSGQQGAGMVLDITTQPTDVSFGNVEVIEIDKGTSNVTGFFSSYPSTELQHHPTSTWTVLTSQNKWADIAYFNNWGTAATWKNGGFQWAIEVRWRVTTRETGQGAFLANRTQVFSIVDSTGKSTVSKLGQSVTRTP
jgi:hypothetical protein